MGINPSRPPLVMGGWWRSPDVAQRNPGFGGRGQGSPLIPLHFIRARSSFSDSRAFDAGTIEMRR